MEEHIYSELQVGESAYFEKTITETDVYMYAGITGDLNWLHVNKVRAENSRFKQRIAHGMLLIGLVSNVIGNQLPGSGTVYVEQNMKFVRPCYINDTVKAYVEVLEILPKGRVKLATRCYNQNDEILIDGEAIVMPPRERAN